MNDNQTLIAAIAAMVIIAGLTIFAVAAAKPALHPKPHITVWQYQGHDMLRYTYNGSASVCHSPQCRKCIQVYD